MELKNYSRQQARNFAVSWTIIFCFFAIMVIWSLISGYAFQKQDPRVPTPVFWSHMFLMALVLLSLFAGAIGMWRNFFSEDFEKVRKSRNISFFVVLFLYPLSLIINLIFANLH